MNTTFIFDGKNGLKAMKEMIKATAQSASKETQVRNRFEHKKTRPRYS
jgi:hypothetical protein